MEKEYRVYSEISRQEYSRLFTEHLLHNEKTTLIYAVMVWIISTGMAGIKNIVLISFIIVFFTAIYLYKKYREFMKDYTKEQVVIFSELGMRDERNISCIHWIVLKNISTNKSWLVIKGPQRRRFFIRREALSTEQVEFLNKRLRGI